MCLLHGEIKAKLKDKKFLTEDTKGAQNTSNFRHLKEYGLMLKQSKITLFKQLEIWEQAANTKNYEYNNEMVIICITV